MTKETRCACDSTACSHDGRCDESVAGPHVSNHYCERCLANARTEAEKIDVYLQDQDEAA